jgi:NADH-ubiquinone oxidoreductase chain 1
MTEHAAVIFVFFFLAEYASIVLICVLISILFIGGYLYNYLPFLEFVITIYEYIYQSTDFDSYIEYVNNNNILLSNSLIEGLVYGLVLGLKTCIMIFIFIWVRASFPRIRFDQLMSFCWTILLPIVISFVVFIPCILYSFEIIPSNIFLL